MSEKKTVYIYVNPKSQKTAQINKFIGQHLQAINKRVYVKLIRVTPTNHAKIKSKGIDQTPTLVCDGKKVMGVNKIIDLLRPPEAYRDNFGNVTSAEEMVHKWMSGIAYSKKDDDEDDEMDPEKRSEYLRQKMAAMQKKRPEMAGVDKKQKIKGGRKIAKTDYKKQKFRDDDDFIQRRDNFDETPTDRYLTDDDGLLMLEELRNEIADSSGRKVGRNISKRR